MSTIYFKGLAQEHIFYHYNTRNGLPSNRVKAVAQDDQGNVWIPSEKGVTKFNGKTFKTFSVKDGLPTNEVFFTTVCNNNEVWIYDYHNSVTYIKRDTIHTQPINNYSRLSTFHKKYFRKNYDIVTQTDLDNTTILFSKNGYTFSINSINLLTQIPLVNDSILHKLETDIEYLQTKCAVTIANGILILLIEDRLYHYNLYTGDKGNFLLPTKRSSDIHGIYPDVYSNYFFYASTNQDSLIFIDINTQNTKIINLAKYDLGYNGTITHLIEHDTTFTITTRNQQFIQIDTKLNIIDDFQDTTITNVNNINKDNTGNYWIATNNNGLFLLSKYFKPFIKKNLEFKTDRVLNVFEHGNKVFIFDRSSTLYITDKAFNLLKRITLPIVHKSYPEISRYWFFPDGGRGYYIASAFGIYYLTKSFEITKCTSDNRISCKYFYYDSTDGGKLIIASSLGFHLASAQNDFKVLKAGRSLSRIMRVDKAPDDTYWGTNDQGDVFRSNASMQIFNEFSLQKNVTFSAFDDSNFVFSVEGYGLYYYNTSSSRVHHIIKDNNFQYYKKSKRGGIWVANEDYIMHLSYTDGKYHIEQKLLNLNGLLYHELYNISECSTKTYLLCDNGMIELPSKGFSYSDTSFTKSAYLSAITIQNDSTYYFNKTDSSFKYEYTGDNINLQFSANSTAFLGNIHYKYYIEDQSGSWLTTNSEAINYPSLSPGTYNIHFKAVANNLNLQTDEVIFKLTILPKWWQSIFFKIVLALIALSISGYLIYLRINVIKEREQKQSFINKKMAELELSALQSQMNPHFIFNSLTSIQSFINTNQSEDADKLLQQFSLLVRLYLEFSRNKLITLEQELKSLKLYTEIEQLRFSYKFDVKFRIRNTSELTLNEVRIPPMLIQPLVENAINHGLYHKKDNHGLLRIFFIINRKETKVIIDDNGIGRDKAKKLRNKLFPSIGNKLIKDRVNILNESGRAQVHLQIIDKTDANNKALGTRVILTFANQHIHERGHN